MFKSFHHHWQVKLGSLLAAAVVWYLLRQAIRAQSGPVPARTPVPAASTGRFP